LFSKGKYQMAKKSSHGNTCRLAAAITAQDKLQQFLGEPVDAIGLLASLGARVLYALMLVHISIWHTGTAPAWGCPMEHPFSFKISPMREGRG